MHWITSTDLKNWAPKRDCQENLPLLVRKLIRASSSNISKILFPAGDSVVYSGWDGILESSVATEYIPNGTSLWEFGTEKTITKKANEDYEKRKLNSLGHDPHQATFIFVTPYHWPNKDKWITDRKKEKHWKDVRVYDSEHLEEWIDEAPAVGTWLAKYLKLFPEGVQSVDDFWSEWISNPSHKISPKLLTSGRDEQVENITEWLSNPRSLFRLISSSREESLAFICSIIEQMNPDLKEYYLSKSIIVDNEKSFKSLISTRDNLILIPYFDETSLFNKAIESGHHVYSPLGMDSTFTTDVKILPRINRDGFISTLVEMGFDEEIARKYSKETGRILSVFRRVLQYNYNQPKWAKRETSRGLIPILLCGRWDENYSGDKELIGKLSGLPYEEVVGTLQAWTFESDPPILKVGNKWRLTSPTDAWSALARYLTNVDTNTFKKLVLDALIEHDEIVENKERIPLVGETYRASNHYSSWLKEGICQTLILIAVLGDDYNLTAIDDKQDWVDSIVNEVLGNLTGDTLISVNQYLTLLSEASPKSFLNAW
jgi:hypothetical protein